jgi:hypothetical protein
MSINSMQRTALRADGIVTAHGAGEHKPLARHQTLNHRSYRMAAETE